MKYPENHWEEDDIKKMKFLISSGQKELECPDPDCDGVIGISRNDDLKDKNKKKGDFFLELECSKCRRRHSFHMLGHLE